MAATQTQTETEAWERGERRRTRMLGALTASVLLLAVAVGTLAAHLKDQPGAIDVIRQAEEETACVEVLKASFLASVGDLLDASIVGDQERSAAAQIRLQLNTAAQVILATKRDEVNPCTIPVPPPAVPAPGSAEL